MDARAYLGERRALIEGGLDAALPPASREPMRLHAAMRHLMFPGGKRLRPALALAAAEAVGGSPESALPAAVAVELVHVYSLVHDDLPCMDDDDERRGVPTVHVAFDEATAVLAGDALLTAAFEVLAAGGGDDARTLGSLRDLARAAGAAGLVGGQVDDLSGAGADAEAIESVHRRKTARLMAAAVTCGARLGGADAKTLEGLERAGLAAGVGFQIADDLEDATTDTGPSLAVALGIGPASERAEGLLAEALAELEGLGSGAEPIRALFRFAVRRK